jgi:O-antigen ligase
MTPLYTLAALVALVWGMVYLVRGSLLAGCLVVLVVMGIFGYEFVHFDLGPVPLTLDRILLPALIAAYVVQRCRGRIRPGPLAWSDVLLIAFLGLLGVSGCVAGWGIGKTGLAGDAEPLVRLLLGYLIPFSFYWIARGSRADESQLTMVHATLACLGIYLGVTGLLEVSHQWWAVFPRHIADPEAGIHFGRARGPMVQAVRYGLWLGVCLLAALSWRPRLRRRGQLVLIALVPLMLAALFFSLTRSVWLGTAAGITVLLGFTLRGAWRPLVLGGAAAAGLLVAVLAAKDLAGFDREQSAQASRHSVSLRGSFAYISWLMFLDRPLLGCGFGQFPEAKLPYTADRSTELDLESTRNLVHHNHFLSVLTETGLVGFVLFLAVLACWARTAWKIARRPDVPTVARSQAVLLLGAMAVWAAQLAFHEMSYSVVDNSLVFFLAGLTMGLSPVPKQAGANATQRAVPLPAPMMGHRRPAV